MNAVLGFALAGLGYGIVLFLFAFVCAGGGNGSYLPFAVFGAPVSLIPFAGLFAAPVLWAACGFLLGRNQRPWAIALLLIHLAGVAVVILVGNPFEDSEAQWEYFHKAERFVPGALWGGLATYLAGQLAMWALALVRRPAAS